MDRDDSSRTHPASASAPIAPAPVRSWQLRRTRLMRRLTALAAAAVIAVGASAGVVAVRAPARTFTQTRSPRTLRRLIEPQQQAAGIPATVSAFRWRQAPRAIGPCLARAAAAPLRPPLLTAVPLRSPPASL